MLETQDLTQRLHDDLAARIARALDDPGAGIVEAMVALNSDEDFAHSAARTLLEEPKRLETRFLYDSAGSALFERICEQPEYYPTRTEAAILERCAGEIAAATGDVHLAELGSGFSVKTRHILRAYAEAYGEVHYVPIDVSRSALVAAGRALTAWDARVNVAGIHGTYEAAMPLLDALSPAMVIFLGSTIGNFTPEQETRFWQAMVRGMSAGDFVLLGVDLVKSKAVLDAAYNDEAGVTAAFTRNLFERMNRELGTNLDVENIEHVAEYVEAHDAVEIGARFETDQTIHIPALGRRIAVAAGETIHTEVSRKYRMKEVSERLGALGLSTVQTWSDERDWFGLLLLRKI